MPPQPLYNIVAFECQGELRRGLPAHVAVEDVKTAIGSGIYRRKTETGLHRNRRCFCHADAVGVLLSQVVIHRPANGFARGRRPTEQLVFETVRGLDLVGTVDQPVVQCKLVIDRVTGAESHVVKGQEVEPERSRIIHLVFGVIPFHSNRTGELPKIDIYATAYGNNIGTVSLKNVAVNIRPRLVGRITLQRICRLAKLQVETATEAAPVGNVGKALKYHIRLIQAKTVAENVIGSEQIDSTDRSVEVVFVISIERNVDGSVAQKVEGFSVLRRERRLLSRKRSGLRRASGRQRWFWG